MNKEMKNAARMPLLVEERLPSSSIMIEICVRQCALTQQHSKLECRWQKIARQTGRFPPKSI
jgi:hypothetical protein